MRIENKLIQCKTCRANVKNLLPYLILRSCFKTISSPDSEPVSMRFCLSDESADAEGAIGDEETNEMCEKSLKMVNSGF